MRSHDDRMVGIALHSSQKQAKRSARSCESDNLRRMPPPHRSPRVAQILVLLPKRARPLPQIPETPLQCRVGSSTEAVIHCQRRLPPATGEGTKRGVDRVQGPLRSFSSYVPMQQCPHKVMHSECSASKRRRNFFVIRKQNPVPRRQS